MFLEMRSVLTVGEVKGRCCRWKSVGVIVGVDCGVECWVSGTRMYSSLRVCIAACGG